MKRFYLRDNKDSGAAFASALLAAGYQRVECVEQADFALYDHDHYYDRGMKPLNINCPLFIYPHVPYSWFLWDGILEPQSVSCNFVVSNGAKVAMQLYGYPEAVEVIGAAGMEIKPFAPTSGTKLLFAPAHPIHDGRYPQREALVYIRATAEKIMKHLDYFESVTVRHSNTLIDCGLEIFTQRLTPQKNRKIIFEQFKPYATPNLRQEALSSIHRADLVVSNSTFGYLSVAEGKPTIFYGYDNKMIPYSREGYAKNYPLYKHIFHFPINFVDMSIEGIMAVRDEANSTVEQWKRLNIGESFCASEFVKKLENYL